MTAESYRNMGAPPIPVDHGSLAKFSDESEFKVYCPVCKDGLLLVARDQNTLRLVREDRCITCGQHFMYLDDVIGGEALPHGRIRGALIRVSADGTEQVLVVQEMMPARPATVSGWTWEADTPSDGYRPEPGERLETRATTIRGAFVIQVWNHPDQCYRFNISIKDGRPCEEVPKWLHAATS